MGSDEKGSISGDVGNTGLPDGSVTKRTDRLASTKSRVSREPNKMNGSGIIRIYANVVRGNSTPTIDRRRSEGEKSKRSDRHGLVTSKK